MTEQFMPALEARRFCSKNTDMKLIRFLSLALFSSCVTISAWSKPFDVTGQVVHVDDGDTIVVLMADQIKKRVRLASIDAPESSHTKSQTGRIGQPYAQNSKQFLAALVNGKDVNGLCFEVDRYGRDVCEIFVGRISVNREMIRHGWAWANVSGRGRFLRDKSLVSLEALARGSYLGLWKGNHPVPPWEWRDACWKQQICVQDSLLYQN